MNKLEIKELSNYDIPLFTKWLNKDYVKKWYHNPEDWLYEVKKRDTEFFFVKHKIAYLDDIPFAFCQYYDCYYAQEAYLKADKPNEVYSIDYLIGEEEFLHKGNAPKIIIALTDMIKKINNSAIIIVQPEPGNNSSRKALTKADYQYNNELDYYFFP